MDEGPTVGLPVSLVASPDAVNWAVTYGGFQNVTMSDSGTALLTNIFDVAVTSAHGAEVQWAISSTNTTYAGYVGNSDKFATGGVIGRLVSGNELYATGCVPGTVPDCVNF